MIFDGVSQIYPSSDVFWNNIISYLNVLPTSATLGENRRMQRINVTDNDICNGSSVVLNLTVFAFDGIAARIDVAHCKSQKGLADFDGRLP